MSNSAEANATNDIHKKLILADKPAVTVRETVVVQQGTSAPAVSPLLKRAFLSLEDGEWEKADSLCEQILNQEPENAMAYLGKLMADVKCRSLAGLKDCPEPFDGNNNYNKVLRFGSEKLKALLTGSVDYIKRRNEAGIYKDAVIKMSVAKNETEYKKAAEIFASISGFKDADERYALCQKRIAQIKEESEKAAKRSRVTWTAIVVLTIFLWSLLIIDDMEKSNKSNTKPSSSTETVSDWMKEQAVGKDYSKDDGGIYYCMGKNDTCPRTTKNAYDLYCDQCDPDGNNIEGRQ